MFPNERMLLVLGLLGVGNPVWVLQKLSLGTFPPPRDTGVFEQSILADFGLPSWDEMEGRWNKRFLESQGEDGNGEGVGLEMSLPFTSFRVFTLGCLVSPPKSFPLF